MYRIIDLFAGIGGTRLGFERAAKGKIQCVFTSETDKFAVQTYKANFDNDLIHGDIKKIDEASIPDHDILLAGFPCQPFSQAGRKRGFSDYRGTLFFDIERILLKKQPRTFLLENVRQLKGHDGGKTFNYMLTKLKEARYKVFHKLIGATDFGLPQNRIRLYIVGFLNHNINFEFPEPNEKEILVGDILEKNVSEEFTISARLWEGHKRRKREHRAKGNGFGYGIFNERSLYTNTLSARYYKDGSEILIEQKGKNPRMLTPRECARLQGFGDNFKIPVSKTQAYKQFGNSIPVNVVEAIAKKIISALDNEIELKKIKDSHPNKITIS